MDLIEFPAKCPACGDIVDLRGAGFCLFCDRFVCGRHLTTRGGITNCADCEGERNTRLAEAAITEADQERLLTLIRRDLEATVGPVATPVAIARLGELKR